MKVPTYTLRKAAAKRKKALEGAEGPSTRPRTQVPSQPVAQPSPSLEHGESVAVPTVDPTTDTPSEGARVEGAAAAEPPVPTAQIQAEAGSPSEEPAASNPTPAVPGPTEEREAEPIPSRPSIMNDGRRVEWLISHLIQPEFQEELSQLGASIFFHEAFVALTRLTNSLVATREVINQGKVIISEAWRDAEDAQARAERAEGTLEAARTNRATELEEAARQAEVEADRARAALNQLGVTEGDVCDRDRHIAKLRSSIQTVKARAEHAEEEARRAASLVAEEETKARKAETAAEVRVVGPIEEFRQSTLFSEEMAEASADAYLQGF